ncbi:MAG: hypothetical protein ACLGI2_02725 [Acidimicrobiia bacterium]
MSAEEAEWWGAALAVLVAAIHHPHVLAAREPDTDPAHVAQEVLGGLGELQGAAACAASQTERDDADERRGQASVHAEGDDLVFSPGAEVANLAFCLLAFATAVLDPGSPEGSIAQGATAYAASAWSRDIGRASGAL